MQHASSTPTAALQKCEAALVVLVMGVVFALPSAAQPVASQLETAAAERRADCFAYLENPPSFEANSNRRANQFVPCGHSRTRSPGGSMADRPNCFL